MFLLLFDIHGKTGITRLQLVFTSQSLLMKHVKWMPLAFLLLVVTSPLMAQSGLAKADKEYELHAYQRAVTSYLSVLKPDSENANAMGRLADSYRHLNQLEEALIWYERAVAQKQVNPQFLLQYGKVLMNLGFYEEAKDWLKKYGEGRPAIANNYIANCDFAIAMRGVTPLYKVKREFLNTEASDFGPAIYKDQVVYASSRTDIKRTELEKDNSNWAGENQSQLYITSRDGNGFLRQPAFLHSDLRNKYQQGPVSYSADGKFVAFTRNNFTEGTRQIPSSGLELSIYIAEVDRNGDWKDARPFTFNGTGYSTGYPCFSPDGQNLYFASDRPDGFGGFDIYVSRRIGATWSSPENLGSAVNTAGNEITPFYDGTSIYFASDWHQGLGGFDLFRAEMENRSWKNLFHLGNGVNSSLDDYGFVYDNKNNLGYFTSNRGGGKGNEDIYQVAKLTDVIEIVVVNAFDQGPIAGAKLDFSACDEPVFATNDAGIYQFQALAGLDCEVIVSKDGFESGKLQVLSAGKRESKRYEVKLMPESDPFIGNILDASSNRPLDEVLVRAMERGTGRIIESRSGSTGSYSLKLRPGYAYDLRFSRAGYEDFHFNVEIKDATERSVLGVMRMQSAGTRVESGGRTASAPPTSGTSIPNTASTAVPPGTSLSGEDETTAEKSSRYSDLDKGYAVQLAALPGNTEVKSAEFANMEPVGNLYSRSEKGMNKVRIGIYATKKEASDARQEAVKKGYKTAFVVVETLEDMDEVNFLNVAPPSGLPSEETPREVPAASSALYPIRFSWQPIKIHSFLSRIKSRDWVQLERRRKGDFTIMLLGGFDSLEEAVQASNAAVRLGFEGAHVVIDEKTRLVRVNP